MKTRLEQSLTDKGRFDAVHESGGRWCRLGEQTAISQSTAPGAGHTAEAQQRLQQSGYAALKKVRCEHYDGAIVLHGSVPSYHMKQLAQTVVRAVSGVTAVVNNVQVSHDLQRN